MRHNFLALNCRLQGNDGTRVSSLEIELKLKVYCGCM